MPDGPRYEDDFYAWTQYQAEVLRSMPAPDRRFYREHVVVEIEDLGKSETRRGAQPDPPDHRALSQAHLLAGPTTSRWLDGDNRRGARNAFRQVDRDLASRG